MKPQAMTKKEAKIFGEVKKKYTVKKQTAYPANFKVTNDGVTITLPKEVLDLCNLNGKKVTWTIINNCIQISGFEPNFFIPAINLNIGEFIPHKK